MVVNAGEQKPKGDIFFRTIVRPLIDQYSQAANAAIQAGDRNPRLNCQNHLKDETSCTKEFLQECEQSGLLPALRGHLSLCSKGPAVALGALITGTGIALGVVKDPIRPCD